MTTRVIWTPRTNTQRSAVARFAGVEWERTAGVSEQTFAGHTCVMVNPVGFRREGRWVNADEVTPADTPMPLVPGMPNTL
jgi:hypothetical protein